MSKAIKYESTTVEPEQSAAEIMQLVSARLRWATFLGALR